MALDDRKRKAVVAIFRPGGHTAAEREIPAEPHHIGRLFRRLKRQGRGEACYETGVWGYDLYRQTTACQV